MGATDRICARVEGLQVPRPPVTNTGPEGRDIADEEEPVVKTGEWLSEAWSIVQQDLWTYVLLALIVAVGNSVTGGLLYGPWRPAST